MAKKNSINYGNIRSKSTEEFARCIKAGKGNGSSRLNVEPEKVEQGLAKLVLCLIELIRQLLEKQAIRRMEGGSLNAEEIERLGVTLMRLEEKMEELKEHFGIDDLNINLGPLGNLID